ncbi:MAG: phosphoadenylyl-sulfate reductase [Alphaproteobacteria bacterium]|jgi:phosphoadenosine phosphosulfate reductase
MNFLDPEKEVTRADPPLPRLSHNRAQLEASRLLYSVPDGDGVKVLEAALTDAFAGRIAIMSSFGAESAVLLHLVSRIAPRTPVVFLDTGMLFAQTEQYQRALTDMLGLTDIRVQKPDADEVAAIDPVSDLWQRDSDACCNLRKVIPLERALAPFDAWVTGRKRFQGATRSALPVVEVEGARIKVNPLVGWSQQRLSDYFIEYALPHHPLYEFGYLSIGCHTCTRPVAPGEDIRAGRWSGLDKSECGIHTNRWGSGARKKA